MERTLHSLQNSNEDNIRNNIESGAFIKKHSSIAPSNVTANSVYTKILCCLCGISIDPNGMAMCMNCLQLQHPITNDITKTIDITQCKKCQRWHNKLDQWISHELESTGLMTFCLKKINALSVKNDIKILDSKWIWTEPHSRRLKVSIDIERGIEDNKVKIRQRAIIEYVVNMKQCNDCAKEETDHTWGALVQIRQHTSQKRSLIYLEQLMMKNKLNNLMIDVDVRKEGLDLYFQNKSNAEKIVEFISNNIPSKSKYSKKLVSHNSHTGTANTEVTICVDIATLVKDDLIITTKEMIGSKDLMLVTKISSSIHLINPFTLLTFEMNTLKYFSTNPEPLLSSSQLQTYIVLDVEKLHSPNIGKESAGIVGDDSCEGVWCLAEAEVMLESDLGDNDVTYLVTTHLGNILQTGDLVLGFDLRHSVGVDDLLSSLSFECPDILLVRKTFSDKHSSSSTKKNEEEEFYDKIE